MISSTARFRLSSLYIVTIIANLTVVLLTTRDAFAEWPTYSIIPELNVLERYQDRFNFARDSFPIWETDFRAKLDSRIRGDNWKVDIDKEYRASRFAIREEFNRDDWRTNLRSELTTSNLTWGLTAGFHNDHPSSSEVNAGQQNFARITRNRWNIGPSLTWAISDLTSLQATYNFSETGFQDDDEQPRTDFHVHSASLGLFRFLDPATQVFGQFSYVGFFTTPQKSFLAGTPFHDFNNNRIPDPGEPVFLQDTDNDGFPDTIFNLSQRSRQNAKTEQLILQVGFTHAFSETLNISASGGNVWLLSKQRTGNLFFTDGALVVDNVITTRNKQTGYILNFKVNKDFEYSKLSAEFDRSVSATFDGGQVERNEFTLEYSHNVSDKLRANFLFNVFENITIEGIPTRISQGNRNRYTGEMKFIWDFAQHWQLLGAFRHEYEDQKQPTFGPRSINTVYLRISHRWSPFGVFP